MGKPSEDEQEEKRWEQRRAVINVVYALRGVSPTDLPAQPGATGEKERRQKNQTTEMTHSTLAVENMRRNTNQNREIIGGIWFRILPKLVVSRRFL